MRVRIRMAITIANWHGIAVRTSAKALPSPSLAHSIQTLAIQTLAIQTLAHAHHAGSAIPLMSPTHLYLVCKSS